MSIQTIGRVSVTSVLALPLAALVLFSTSVFAREHVLVVSGIGGDEDYSESFADAAIQIGSAYTTPALTSPSAASQSSSTQEVVADSPSAANIVVLTGDSVTRDTIEQALTTISETAEVTDTLIVMLIGHGSYDGEHYKFNIAGPDLTGDQLKASLGSIKCEQQLIVLATSASGVMLKSLETSGRIVISATKSGGEINAVEFPTYWADAVSTENADYDRNEIITAAEAFRYTQSQVEGHYSERNLLASEHPRLQGENADRFSIVKTGSLRGAGDNPAVAALLEERALLENEIITLRDQKNTLSQNDYFEALEVLMLKMARLQIVVDQETGWRSTDEKASDG